MRLVSAENLCGQGWVVGEPSFGCITTLTVLTSTRVTVE